MYLCILYMYRSWRVQDESSHDRCRDLEQTFSIVQMSLLYALLQIPRTKVIETDFSVAGP